MSQFLAEKTQIVKSQEKVTYTTHSSCKNLANIVGDEQGNIYLQKKNFCEKESQSRKKFKITFGANIALPKGELIRPLEIALEVNGTTIFSSNIVNMPTQAERFLSIQRSMILDFSIADSPKIAVKNIGETSVIIQYATLLIEEEE